MPCEFCGKCWRHSYSLYLQRKGDYPSEGPPDRMSLLLDGFATSDMARTKTDPKTGKTWSCGVYAQTLPQPGDTSTWCPDMQGLPPADYCNEYRKEVAYKQKYDKYRAAKMQQQYERFPNMTRRVAIPKSVRQYVWRRDKFSCAYCSRHYADLKDIQMQTREGDGKSRVSLMVIDHMIPLAQGGSNTEDNMVLCCYECNSLKRANVWQRGCRVGMV